MSELIIGLMGGSGSGKTTVSKLFEEKGFVALDADLIAKSVMAPGSACSNEIESKFGRKYFFADGSLNRKKLGAAVFADARKLLKLNEITHKYVIDRIDSKISENKGRDILIDAPALIESGQHQRCDRVILVTAPLDERFSRIMQRDQITLKEAEKRIQAQKSDKEIEIFADFIIENKNLEDTKRQVDDIIAKIRKG